MKKSAIISKIATNRYIALKILEEEGCVVPQDLLSAMRVSAGTKGKALLNEWLIDGEAFEGILDYCC